MRGKINGIIDIGQGRKLITIAVSEDCKELEQHKDKVVDFTIETHREKRSRNANNYLWSLCTQIADIVETSSVYVYKDAIINAGIYKDFHNLTEADCNTLQVAWSRLGIGWLTERVDYEPDGEHLILRCFYGSSTYNTKQMSRLLDYVVQEANNIGVDTDSYLITSLLNDWDKVKEN